MIFDIISILVGGGKKKGSYTVNSSSKARTSRTNRKYPRPSFKLILAKCLVCLCCLGCIGILVYINVGKEEEPRPTEGEYVPDNSITAEWIGDEEEPPLEETVTLTFIYNSIFLGWNKVYKKIRVRKGSTYKFSFWDVPFALPFTAVGWSEQRWLSGDYWYLNRNQTRIDLLNKTAIGVNTGLIPPYQILYAAGLDSYVANKDATFYAIWGKWANAVFKFS